MACWTGPGNDAAGCTPMIDTDRLTLRPWLPRDRMAFAALNADAEVMQHFPRTLTLAESDGVIQRFRNRWAGDGICFGAVERRSDGAFVGMVGLSRVRFGQPGPLEGALEMGWRIARPFWGQGYATEAARGWLAHGFGALDADEIVAFAVPANHRSLAVMRRLGMHADPTRDFNHPSLPDGHPLQPHVVHAITRAGWSQPSG